MKTFKWAIVVVVCLCGGSVLSQVGMTTNSPNKDAALDLNNASGPNIKGLLLPKIALTGTTNAAPLTAHVQGMYVYNTATVSDVTPGLYCNDGGKWVRITPVVAWSLTGNAGTDTAVNFIGTTSAMPIYFKSNNQKVGMLSTGNVVFGNGAGAGMLGTSNVAIGVNAGTNITGGGSNIVIGSGANINNAGSGGQLNIGNILFGLGVSNTIQGTGKIGVNTNQPSTELDVNGGARIRTLLSGALTDSVITADANGVLRRRATVDVSAVTLGYATLGAGVDIDASGTFYYTGTKITLPPGKWLVSVNMLLTKSATVVTPTGASESWWMRSSFCNSSATYGPSPDIVSGNSLIGGLLAPSSPYGLLNGTAIISNTTGANKTYYYWAGGVLGTNTPAGNVIAKFGGSNWSEDYITFQKIN